MSFLRLAISCAFAASLPSAFAQPVHAVRLRFDADVEPALKKQVLDDLAFVATLKGNGQATRAHQEIFGKMDGKAYAAWFADRVQEVGKSLCGDDKAVACVLSAWDNKMWFSPNYTKFDHPQIARLMVIFHEARHTEADEGNWPHAKCPKPFLDGNGKDLRSIWTGALLEGEAACDSTVYGSYGSATVFLQNIAATCANCSEKVKMDADLYGADQLNRLVDPADRQRLRDEAAKLTRD